MSAGKTKGVRTTHPDYDRYLPKWKRCADVVSGQDAIHAGRTLYLKKLTGGEEPEDYEGRLSRSDFFNATWRAINTMTGMAFNKPPARKVPAAIEKHLSDVTMTGVSMDALAQDLIEDVLELGRMGLMVDHPPAPEKDESGNVVNIITKARGEELGLRPKMQIYGAMAIRNWKYAMVRNAWVLVQVVLEEASQVEGDEFSRESEPRYRVLDLDGGNKGHYRQRVFRVNERDEDEQVGPDIYPMMDSKPLDYLPFKLVGPNGKGDRIDEPPLIDLVDKNLAHYRVNSVLQHTLNFAPPTFYISGYTLEPGEKIRIGGTTAMVFPDPNAKAAYAEPDGNTIPALERTLDRFERQMALMSVRAIADEAKQAETLGATRIKRAGENSIVAATVIAVSEALEWALGIFSEWAGASGEIEYQINRDFSANPMGYQEWLAVMSMREAGELTSEEAFKLYQRADLIDGAVKFEEHQATTDAQGPARPAAAVPANDGSIAA